MQLQMILQITTLTVFLIGSILLDYFLIKKGQTISHGFNAFKTIFVGLLVLGWDEPNNILIAKYMLVYLSSWWMLFDLGLNIARGLPWDYVGKTAELDKLLHKVKINQFIIKIALILISIGFLKYR